MLNKRIAIAGLASVASIGAALSAQGAKVVEAVKPSRELTGIRTIAKARRSSAPKLKRPRTPHDFAMIAKAQAKRERKAVKLQRDAMRTTEGIAYQKRAIVRQAECMRISARVKAEAMAVYRELEAEQAGATA